MDLSDQTFYTWMVAGVLAGVLLGKNLPEDLFKSGMAIIILISVVMMYYWERKKNRKVPTHWSFAALMGIIAGFTTMVGNLAGAFSNIYFLAIKLPKTNSLALLLGCFLLLIYSKFLFIYGLGEQLMGNHFRSV